MEGPLPALHLARAATRRISSEDVARTRFDCRRPELPAFPLQQALRPDDMGAGLDGAGCVQAAFRDPYRTRVHSASVGSRLHPTLLLSLIHISEPTRLGMISYAVFCLK